MASARPAETIVALSSGPLPAAIAVIRTSGPDAGPLCTLLAGSVPPPRRASLRMLRDPKDGALVDRALVIYFPGTRTATGEDIVEYQCHGSRAVVAALLKILCDQPGARLAEPGEYTRRALSNGRIDLTQAEGYAELLEAESEAQRVSALTRAEGSLRARIEQWQSLLLTLSAEVEVAIDHVDEEDGSGSFKPGDRIDTMISEIRGLLDAPRVERLKDGIRVVVAGPPNGGKSSLVNALAGEQRAIVTPIAGTTRDVIEVPLNLDGSPLTLVDTAGLRETDDEIERIGVELAQAHMLKADILLWLGDAVSQPAHANIIAINSKCDLHHHGSDALNVSAVSGEGIETLKKRLVVSARKLVPSQEQLGVNAREAGLLERIYDALIRASMVDDPVLTAEEFREARHSLNLITGKVGVEVLLDEVFSRFCLGK